MARLGTLAIAGVGALVLLVASCSVTPGMAAPVVVRIWAHSGTLEEQNTLRAQVREFNARQDSFVARLRLIPEGRYNDHLDIAAAGGRLPDVLDVDGPLLAAHVHADRLIPLDDLLPARALESQLPSLKAQGQLEGRTYAIGTFDSGLGLYADRRAFERLGIDLPTTAGEAWSASEFTQVLRRLAEHDGDGRVLDLKRNYGVGEWLTYGFAPLVASAGGSLIDPATQRASGALNGPATLQVLRTLRTWAPYVDENADDRAFVERRAPLSWVGHWAYPEYSTALGRDLAVVPLPDLGHGSKTGQGSWAWAIAAKDEQVQEGAGIFLSFLLSDAEVARTAAANGAVPGTLPALARSDLYAEEGPLRLFVEQLLASCGDDTPSRHCVAVPRPQTPVYPVLSGEFAQLVDSALRGDLEPESASEAASIVDEELRLIAD